MKLRLTVTVDYEPNGVPEEKLRELLGAIIDRAVNNGTITDDTDAEMTNYEFETDNITEPQNVWIIWGSHVASEDALCHYQYETHAQLEAFLEGVDAAVGHLDHHQENTLEAAQAYLRERLYPG